MPEFTEQAGRVAAASHAMAVRFHQGGKLVVFGSGGPSSDAQHVAVEFVHPVIVGKRALPAISLTSDMATVTGVAERAGMAGIFAHQIAILAEPADIALGISTDGDSRTRRSRPRRAPGPPPRALRQGSGTGRWTLRGRM